MRGRLPAFVVMLLLLPLMAGLSACKPKPEQGVHAGKAFLDSQIPPGLSPQYYPPEGFVWGGYKAGSLPQSRYGVASPPVNPKAQVLIIADADYPAEVYFEVARQLLTEGIGVWLFEPPGQGGSGRYGQQSQALELRDYRHPMLSAESFVREVIAPSPERPLYIVGTGYSAVTALMLQSLLKNGDTVGGFIGFDPYAGGDIASGEAWTRDVALRTYWGQIGQNWQMSNPDLRLRQKSESWITHTQKAVTELSAVRRPAITVTDNAQGVLILQSQRQAATHLSGSATLCAQLAHCQLLSSEGPQSLGREIAAYITPKVTLRKGLRVP
jgi:pimeloyl-ACP methyl ester carboxylesterase